MLWHKNRHHHIDLISIVHIGVGHHIVVALGIDIQLVVVVVIVVEVVVDVGHDGEDIHGGCKEGHLSNIHCGSIGSCRAPAHWWS